MKSLYDSTSREISALITKRYSTSFTMGTRLLSRDIRPAIYAIYGFVRVADEIVDTFEGYDQRALMTDFIHQYEQSLATGISTNPVLNAFQAYVLRYNMQPLVERFLHSMCMDLDKKDYTTQEELEQYVDGSAVAVGLMCLKLFVQGDQERYDSLEPYAMSLGSAFQKVNFLRDLKSDYQGLGRVYFPDVDIEALDEPTKQRLVDEVAAEFVHAEIGIRQLPKNCQLGVYVCYKYYLGLLRRIKKRPPKELLTTRIRVPDAKKYLILAGAYLRYKLVGL